MEENSKTTDFKFNIVNFNLEEHHLRAARILSIIDAINQCLMIDPQFRENSKILDNSILFIVLIETRIRANLMEVVNTVSIDKTYDDVSEHRKLPFGKDSARAGFDYLYQNVDDLITYEKIEDNEILPGIELKDVHIKIRRPEAQRAAEKVAKFATTGEAYAQDYFECKKHLPDKEENFI